jgi:membrane protein DedA with SNARE-associated domain
MTFGLAQLAGMFGVVAFGAVVPVLPTGAAVSVTAVLAASDHALLVLVVVAVGAAGAYFGDLVTYAVLRFAGEGLSRRVRWLQEDAQAAALQRFGSEIAAHELRTLLLSRLVPGGRIPVLLAAAIGGYPFRRYVMADLAAALLWSIVYAAIGLFGRTVFPEPWQGAVAAVVLIIVISLIPPIWRRISNSPAEADAATPH